MTTPTPVASVTAHNDKVTGPALCSGARAITAELPAGSELDSMTSTELAEVLRRLDLALYAQRVYVEEGTASGADPAGHPGSEGVALIHLAGAAVVDAYTAAQARERNS